MEIHHIVLTSERESRLALLKDEEAYRLALHKLGRVFKGTLALFALIAEHLHMVSICSRVCAGRLARAAALSLRPIVSTPLAPSYIKPVESRGHMRWLLKYELDQPAKHGMPGPPALWSGSCLPDLVGARQIPGLSLCIRQAIPDFSVGRALGLVGLKAFEVDPAKPAMIRAAGAHRLVAAAAAALGAMPTLEGTESAANLARRAVGKLAKLVGISLGEVSCALDIDGHSVRRARKRPVDDETLDTIARRLILEDLVHRAIR